MALIKAFKYSTSSASTTITPSIPSHVSGDLLIIFSWINQGSASTWTTPSGWTRASITGDEVGGQITGSAYYLQATSSSETAVLTNTVTQEWAVYVVVIEAGTYDTSNPFDVLVADDPGFASGEPLPTVTTTENNTLLLYASAMNQSRRMWPGPELTTLSVNQSNDTTSILGYSVAEASGSQSDVAIVHTDGTDSTITYVFAVNDVTPSTPSNMPYIPPTAPPHELLWIGNNSDTLTSTITTGGITTIDSIATVAQGSINEASAGINTAHYANRINIDADNPGLTGGEVTLLSATDMSAAGFLAAVHFYVRNRLEKTRVFPIEDTGVVFTLRSSGGWVAYVVGGSDSSQDLAGPGIAVVDVNDSVGFQVDSSGTFDSSAVTHIGFYVRPSSTQSSVAYSLSMLSLLPATIAGGCEDLPIRLGKLAQIVLDMSSKGVQEQGDGQVIARQSVQIGTSTLAPYWQERGFSLQFAPQHDVALKRPETCTGDDAFTLFLPLTDDAYVNVSGAAYSTSAFNISVTNEATDDTTITLNLEGTQFIGAGSTVFDAFNDPISSVTFSGRDTLDLSTDFLVDCSGGCTFSNATGAAVKITNQAQLDRLDNCVFTSNQTAIEVDVAGSISLDFSSLATMGTSNTFYVEYTGTGVLTAQTAASWPSGKLNASGGGSIVVSSPPVTVKITVTDASQTAIENANVYLEAAAGGDLGYRESVTLTRSGSTVTVQHTAHGKTTGDVVKIRSADQDEYNIAASITVLDVNSYTYTVTGTPTTPATGTITATDVILSGLTDASGVLQDTGFVYSSTQPVSGTARKTSASPYYQVGRIVGNITSAGLDTNILLSLDE